MRAHLAAIGCNGQEISRAHLAAIGCNGLIASDIPDRKLEIPRVGLAGPDQEAAILAPFHEQLLCLLTSDVSMKPPAWERRDQ